MKLVYPAVFTPYEDGSGGYSTSFGAFFFCAEDFCSGGAILEYCPNTKLTGSLSAQNNPVGTAFHLCYNS